MPLENPKSSSWTSVPVKGLTAAAVWALQQSYMRRHGRSISQDQIVATALGLTKVADLPPPPKRATRTRGVPSRESQNKTL